jgi:hypothetical protein
MVSEDRRSSLELATVLGADTATLKMRKWVCTPGRYRWRLAWPEITQRFQLFDSMNTAARMESNVVLRANPCFNRLLMSIAKGKSSWVTTRAVRTGAKERASLQVCTG